MTEDEAKTKWCPFARYTSVRGTGINRWIDEGDTNMSPDPAKCIGSACMAWREVTSFRADRLTDEIVGGYCGLAGAPQ